MIERVVREIDAYIMYKGKKPKYILLSETAYMMLSMEIENMRTGNIHYGSKLTEFQGIPVVVMSDVIGVY